MNNIKITRNPFLLFSPFLVLFIIYIIINPTEGLGDERRYLMFAHNLVNGFYSPPMPNINLTNGPGYPIILAPFVAFGFPLRVMALMNAIFYYFSIIFLYKALEQTVSYKMALTFSFFWACYYIAYQNIPFITTETFTYLLVSILIFTLIKSFKSADSKENKKYPFIAGFVFGFIVLTKIAFVYVLLVMLLGGLLLWLTNRKKRNHQINFLILIVAFATVLPYMVYTYNLTGRMFYWNSNSGGVLYWSSTPFKDEYGDWKEDLTQGTLEFGNYNIPGAGDSLKAHHQKDYNEIFKYDGMAQDDAFKKIAINNIKAHPLKYLQNCIYNVGRLIFHYPFSQAIQRPKVLLVLPLNGIVFSLLLFCLIPTFKNWQEIIYPLRIMLIFAFLYLGLSSLVTAYVRMFTIIVPILMFWFAYIFQKSVTINFKFKRKE